MTDELFDRLRAANPVDPDHLPSANEPAAQHLLETLMTDADTSTPGLTATGVSSSGDRTFAPPPAAAGETRRAPRKWGQSILVAAAALLLIMGAVVLWPSNTEPALAAVQNAAQTTANTESGRASTTFNVAATDDDVESAEAVGTVEVTFSGFDVAFALDIAEATGYGSEEITSMPLPEGRYVDGTVYANFDGEWVAVEAPALITDAALRFADPRNILVTVQELVQTELIGETTIDGMDVTHYQSVVDLGADTLGQAGFLAGLETQMDIEADGEVTIDLYVDDQGRMYRIDVEGDLREPEGSGTAAFVLNTIFSDLDTDITIEAPEGATMLNLGEEMFDEDLFEELEQELDTNN